MNRIIIEEQLAKVMALATPENLEGPVMHNLLRSIPDDIRAAAEQAAEQARLDGFDLADDQELIRQKESSYPYRKLNKKDRGKLLSLNRIAKLEQELHGECHAERVALLALEAYGFLIRDMRIHDEFASILKSNAEHFAKYGFGPNDLF